MNVRRIPRSKLAPTSVIKFEGHENTLVWRHPIEDFNTSSKLIVNDTQEAIIYRNGQMSEPYTAGDHIIETENIPGIRRIVGLMTGGVSPHHYTVYYINKSVIMKVYWGTPQAWIIHDVGYQTPIEITARGQFSVRVNDSKTLLKSLVGVTTGYINAKVEEHFRGILLRDIKNNISEYIEDEGLMFSQISKALVRMSKSIQQKVSGTLEKYGLGVEEFAIESIDVDDRTKDAVTEASHIRFKNRITGYTEREKKMDDIVETAAGNQGNPAMSGMMGLSMGLPIGRAISERVGSFSTLTQQQAGSAGQQAAYDEAKDTNSMGWINHKEKKDSEPEDYKCSRCGTLNRVGAKICKECGSPIVLYVATVICPSCGSEIDSDSKVCNQCGYRMEKIEDEKI